MGPRFRDDQAASKNLKNDDYGVRARLSINVANLVVIGGAAFVAGIVGIGPVVWGCCNLKSVLEHGDVCPGRNVPGKRDIVNALHLKPVRAERDRAAGVNGDINRCGIAVADTV